MLENRKRAAAAAVPKSNNDSDRTSKPPVVRDGIKGLTAAVYKKTDLREAGMSPYVSLKLTT